MNHNQTLEYESPILGPAWSTALIRKESNGITSIASVSQFRLRCSASLVRASMIALSNDESVNINDEFQACGPAHELPPSGVKGFFTRRVPFMEALFHMSDELLIKSARKLVALQQQQPPNKQDVTRMKHNDRRRRMIEHSQKFREFQKEVADQHRVTGLAAKQMWARLVDHSVARQLKAEQQQQQHQEKQQRTQRTRE